MARCAIEWAPPPAGDASGATTAAAGRKDIDLLHGQAVETDPPEMLCAHGERVTLTLTLNDKAQGQHLLLLTSTARLAEVFVNGGAYAGTRVGKVVAAVAGETDRFYDLEVETANQGTTSGPVVLRLAGIKGPFRWRRIQLVGVDDRAGGSASAAAGAAAAAAASLPPPMQTQQQAMAALVALAAAGQSARSEEEQPVPESLRELYAKMATAPDSACGEAVKQMAAALARGVMGGGAGGGGQGPAGAAGGAGAADAPRAAAGATIGEQGGRREAEPPPGEGAGGRLERVLLGAIAASEARVLSAVDALARRVGALEATLAAAAAAARDA